MWPTPKVRISIPCNQWNEDLRRTSLRPFRGLPDTYICALQGHQESGAVAALRSNRIEVRDFERCCFFFMINIYNSVVSSVYYNGSYSRSCPDGAARKDAFHFFACCLSRRLFFCWPHRKVCA